MRRSTTLFALLLLVLNATYAGGPLGGNGTTPRRYPANAMPLVFKTDLGSLGAFNNATAVSIAIYAFTQWDNVLSADLSTSNGGSLPRDVTLSTDALIAGASQFSDGINPIVFDNNGTITDDRIGAGASNNIVGFASSAWTGNSYTEGFAIINGVLTGNGGQSYQDLYKGTMTHEIGHMLGLSHTQTTLHAFYSTMYPIVESGLQAVLRPDDTAAIAALYPTPAFISLTGSISGHVRTPGGAALSGVDVIAIDSVTGATYTTVTDYFSGPGFRFDNKPSPTGLFTINGLPPGRYFIRIEPVRPEFRDGSSIGSYDTPINTTILPEWYNGASENGDLLSDNSNAKTGVVVSAGATTQNIDLVVNESQTASEFRHSNGTSAGYIQFPDGPGGSVTKYALRCTAPSLGSLVGVKFFLGDRSNLPINGRLTISVHRNIPGSLSGIPGAELGSVTIPFTDLDANHENFIYLRGIGETINFPQGSEFHIVFETNGVGLPIMYMDNGQGSEYRSSYFQGANGWRNMGEGLITTPHTLILPVVYTTRVVGQPAPLVTTTPPSLAFGETRPGVAVELPLVVRNSGTALLNVSSTSIGGPDVSLFTITGGAGAFSLQPGDSHTINVKFLPTDASGSKSATLNIISNDPDSPNQIPLTGLANRAIASVLISNIDLGAVSVNSTTNTDAVVLRNTGNDTLRIYGGTLDGGDGGGAIKIVSGNGSRNLLPNATLTVRLRFAPTELRSHSTDLRIAHDAGDTIVIPVTGLGVGASVGAPGEVIIEPVIVGTCRDTIVHIRNDGNTPLTIENLVLGGTEVSDFSLINAPAFPLTVAAGDSIAITIRFCPTALGQRNAELTVTHNGPGSPTKITLIGNPATTGVERDDQPPGEMNLSMLRRRGE